MLIKSALDSYAKSVERSFKHDRSRTVGASEIGSCARRVWWAKRQTEKPDQSSRYGATLRGTVIEDRFWYPAMRAKFKKRLRWSGQYQKTFVGEYLSATPDGLVVDVNPVDFKELGVPMLGDSIVVESKTIDPRVNISEEKSEHAHQVQVQMGLIRKLTTYRPQYAVISYVDASFWNEISEYVVPFRQEVFDASEERAKTILTAPAAELIEPEGWIAGGKECNYCPFIRNCDKARKDVPENEELGDDPQFVAEMTDLCREYLEKKESVKSAEAEARRIQETIRERLKEKGVRKVKGLVSWSMIKGRESWDMKGIREAAEKAGVDLEPFCTVGEPTDRLDVRIKE